MRKGFYKDRIPMTENTEQAVEQVQVNPLERSVELVVEQADVDAGVERRLRQYAKNARMPGFRRGHVPMNQVRAMYGAQCFDETIQELVGQAWSKAVSEGELKVAGIPSIDALPDQNDGKLRFTAKYEVHPEVELPDLSAVEFKQYECEVTDANVDATIETMRKQRAEYTAVEREAKADDRIKLNFRGIKDGEAFPGGTAEGFVFVIGAGQMIEDFEKGVIGMKAGEKKTFPVTFPAEYGIPELNGAEVSFEVEVLEVAEPHYPEVNEEFASSLGVEGGVEKMREEIRSNLEREVKARVEMKTKGEVLEAVNKVLDYPLPTQYVANEENVLLEQMMRDLEARGIKTKDMKRPPVDMFKEQAERRLRLSLFAAKLHETKEVEVTDADIEAEARTISLSYQEPESVVEYLTKDEGSRGNLFNQVLDRKVTAWVLAHGKAETVKVAFDDVMKGSF